MYFNVVVLVIVNGQPTTDDDIDKHEISELISVVAELREELAKVRGELASVNDEHAKSVARIGKLEGKLAATMELLNPWLWHLLLNRTQVKFDTLTSRLSVCI